MSGQEYWQVFDSVGYGRYTFRFGQDLAIIASEVAACLSIHSNQVKDVWSVSEWAGWSEYQYQLSKCIVVSEQ